MTSKSGPRDLSPWAHRLVRGLWALFVFTAVRNAWLCDDAYIYLRAVEQLWAGHGPVWNPGWRVQVFTGPLWYGLLALGRAVLADLYLLTLALSLLLTFGAWHRWRRALPNPWAQALLLALLLVSNGFMDFTTSGLETPLAFFVLSGFVLAYTCLGEDPAAWARLNAWAGLVALTRPELPLLVAPAWLHAARQTRSLGHRAWWRGLLPGLLPVLAWYGFALVYYGSPLPNPVYAKLFHGLPREQVLTQGLRYWLGQVLLDPITVLGMGVALVSLARAGARGRALALGAALYLATLTWAGGDFMAGRFPGLVYGLAWATLLTRIPATPSRPRGAVWTLAALSAYALLFPHTPITSPWDYYVEQDFYLRWGVGDERGRYYRYTSLLTYLAWRTQPDPPPFFPPYAWSQQGYDFRHSPERLAVVDSVGMFGYWAGTDKMVLDVWALTDPLLARLPDADGHLWRPGHYERELPPGYTESLLADRNLVTDPAARSLFDLAWWAARGPLTAAERWRRLPAWWTAHLTPER